jgi:hypothetical protein
MAWQLAAWEEAKIDRELDHAIREWSPLPDIESRFTERGCASARMTTGDGPAGRHVSLSQRC